MSLRAVVFDWGGVLMRTLDYGPRHAWDARLGLAAGSVERVVHGIEEWQQAQRGALSTSQYWAAVGQKLHLSDSDLSALRSDFYQGDRLHGPTASLLARLRSRGLVVGLLSNNTLELGQELERLGLASMFDAVAISAASGAMKPEPAAYRAILGRLACPPNQALMLDDSPANVEGARAVGMAAVRVTGDEEWIETAERILQQE